MDLTKERFFFFSLNLDAEGEPPEVHIRDNDGVIVEVFEEPTCRNPTGWSWEEEDWEPGPFAQALLKMMNEGIADLPEAGEPSGDF